MPGFFEKTPTKLAIAAAGGAAGLALVLIAIDAPPPVAVEPTRPLCLQGTREPLPPPPAPAPPADPCANNACAAVA